MGKNAREEKSERSSLPERLDLCLSCGNAKMIYQSQEICEACWMASTGRQRMFVSCPKEVFSSTNAAGSAKGIRPLKGCYHCPYRRGWNQDDSPDCAFPGPVAVLNLPEGKQAMCPRNLAREGRGVRLDLCRFCDEHAWVELCLDGSGQQWVYCLLPRVVHIYSERSQNKVERPTRH